MSKCDVAVRFDGESSSFVAGTAVNGTVELLASEEIPESAKLVIQQFWRVHGRGNIDEEVVAEQQVELAGVRPGEPRACRFAFQAPDLPISYHGHLVNADHYVRALVDLPWAVDPQGGRGYVVTPSAASAEAYRVAKSKGGSGRRLSKSSKVLGWIFLPILLAPLLLVSLFLLPILLVVGVFRLVRKRLAEGRLGSVTVELGVPVLEDSHPYTGPGASLIRRLRPVHGGTHVVSPGQTLRVSLRFTPNGDVRMNGAQLTLQATELSTSGGGKRSTTHRHTMWEQTVPLSEARDLRRGLPVEVSSRVDLPQTEVYSLDTLNNKVTWTATVRLDIPGWPDWARTFELFMVPGEGTG